MPSLNHVLVTGATGYIGGRLVPRLLAEGYRVRVMVRDPARLQGRDWLDAVEVVRGDAFEPPTLLAALEGIDAAYYLIHSMQGGDDFHERDRTAARSFGDSAREQGVQRIVYLGGLGNPEADLSPHLRSRHETGDYLRESGVPVTELRAAIIVGSGSVSFEMIRHLTERLPIMICPSWVYTNVQPIGVSNALDYLTAVLESPESAGEIIEIGGRDVLTYAEMMLGYAAERGLKRRLQPVPVLTPKLSGYWVHWVTPIPSRIARPLIVGLRNEVIVRDDRATGMFPDIELLSYREAVRAALASLDAGQVETAWSDALASNRHDTPSVELASDRGMIIERRQRLVAAAPAEVFHAFSSLGGRQGWYANWAWRVRGIVDRMVGGAGFRRGRRHEERLRVGDSLDFWRVEAIEDNAMLRLRAEMKVPGRAWLQFDAEEDPDASGRTRLVQTAFFAPHGLAGLLYWYGLYPVHALIFRGMIREVAEDAEAREPS